MFKESLFAQVRRFKQNTDPSTRFRIPIRDSGGLYLGSLVCVDQSLAHEPQVIGDLTQWRSRYMRYFLTQFEATQERTAEWLYKVVLPNDERILFLICTEGDEAVGNFGVCNISPEMGELDNLIRGRKGGDSRLIFFSELAILRWMFCSLNIQTANLHVFSNNTRTIRLHESVGFSIRCSKRLSRIVLPNETRYLVDADEGEPVNFQYEEMFLTKETFLCIYPWAIHSYPSL